jgi:hypothetical protein
MSLATVLLSLALLTPPGAPTATPTKPDHRDLELRFIGWSEDASEYSFQITDDRFLKGEHLDTADTLYVKKLVAKAKSENVVLNEPVKQYLVRRGFARHELEAEKQDQMTTRFKLGERRHLDFTLILKEDLGWRLSMFDGDGSVVILEDKLEEPFTTVEPKIYPSPDNRKLILLIKASTTYRTRDHLKLIRLDL